MKAALAYQLQVGEFFDAKRFVPITNAHFMGDFEVMDASGLAFIEPFARGGARVQVPTTRNSTCVDWTATDADQDGTLVEGERRVTETLEQLGVLNLNTCIGYQSVYVPRFGEHLAWGDTGAVAYANSVLGARSNFEAGPSSLFAGLTGRTPEYGYHLNECRSGNIACRVEAPLRDLADWGALGAVIGRRYRSYWNVPIIELGEDPPSPDALKHLAASLASYGSIAMFHVPGVTPEADAHPAAAGRRDHLDRSVITRDDLRSVYRSLQSPDGTVDVVVFTAPQLSLFELQRLADLFNGQRVHPGVHVIVTTNSVIAGAAAAAGLTERLQQAGVVIYQGTCWYLMQPGEMCRRHGWETVVTNSAKLANIIKAYDCKPVLLPTEECVAAALKGKVT